MQLYVDMDGVLADFDKHHENVFGFRANKEKDDVDWAAIRHVPHFFLHIPPMKDLDELWTAISPYNPIILTGVPHITEAPSNKIGWVRKNLGDDVKVITCRSKEKCTYAKPGDILIDDWEKYKHLWIAKGGIWITHTSAKNSIDELTNLGILNG